MNRRSTRLVALATAAGLAVAALSGCSTGGDTAAAGDDVTLTWWHNGTADPANGFWQDIATEFEEAHPGVTVEVTAVQNEELKTKVAVALQSNNPPDLFQQWGGGQMNAQVEAGKLLDVSAEVTDELALIGGSAAGWQVDGKTYGLPFSMGISGFWYNKTLFEQAGITTAPSTIDELNVAVDKLKAAGITPIVVGAKDKWPAAHYWYWLALRSCGEKGLQEAAKTLDFSDKCFTEAGEELQSFIDTEPFQDGFLGTSAQQGATSSAGLLANGNAAMELMGHWQPGVMGGLTEDGKGLGDELGWFPFPAVSGAVGAADAMLGGGDGYSCSASAPPECVELLKYISSVDVQTRFAETGVGLPVTKGSEGGVTDPNMVALLEARNDAKYVQLWLDIAYGNNVGGALNDAVANMFAGQGSAEDIVTAMNDAAAQQ